MCLLLAGLVLAALLGEIAVRVIGYEGADARQRSVLNTRYGRVTPDKWIFRLDIDPATQRHVQIRSQSIPIEKPDGETRMLFIGDSGTAGLYLDIEDSFPMQFADLLDEQEPGRRIGVINAGAVGMTNVGEFYFLKDQLLHLKPDVVVLGLFLANDLNFNLGHQERPEARGTGWLERLHGVSALAHFLHLRALALRHRGGMWRDTPDVALTLVAEDGLHMLHESAGELATYKKQPSALTERAYVVLRSVLQDILEAGAEHEFRFAVLLIPTRSTIAGRLELTYHPRLLEELAKHGTYVRESDLDFTLPTRRVKAICADLGIPCLDPTERMQRHGMDVFLPNDEHSSVEGHGVLAEEVLANLDRLLDG